MTTLLNTMLNRVTSYRLMLYYLVFLTLTAVILSALSILPYNPLDILSTAVYLLGVCVISNQLLARLFKASPNVESPYITALILALIIGPFSPSRGIFFLTLAGAAAMASKYLLVIHRRHIFNPAALGVTLTALLLHQGASWWVGDKMMAPFIIIGGLAVAAKIRRFNLIIGFLLTYYFGLAAWSWLSASSDQLLAQIQSSIAASPLVFFSFVMLVEPLTSPPDAKRRLYFGVFTGLILLIFQRFLTQIPYTLELALLTSNVFARLTRFNASSRLILLKKQKLAPNILAFFFESERPLQFIAGQFLEWTLPHPHPDSRGVRRYFTIASSPREDQLMLVTKFAHPSSTFKQALLAMRVNDALTVSNLEGDFVLPSDRFRPCVFIAGGIGITPYRSMIKFLLDSKQSQPIILFYSSKSPDEFVFKELLKQANREFGLKTVYIITDPPPANWLGRTGYIDEAMIRQEAPDYRQRLFYLSGPAPMVQAHEKMLVKMGVKRTNIKRDYFPGYSETK